MRTTRPTILLADDDAGWRKALRARLCQSGFDVVTASDGEQAIAAFDEHQVDAALLDVQMPGIDGFGVCEHIRNQPVRGDIPVLFLTGSQHSIVRNHLSRLTDTVGGTRFLTKPCNSDVLVTALQDALNRSDVRTAGTTHRHATGS